MDKSVLFDHNKNHVFFNSFQPMDDLLLLIDGLMKIALLTGIMVHGGHRAIAGRRCSRPWPAGLAVRPGWLAHRRRSIATRRLTHSVADSDPAFIDGTAHVGHDMTTRTVFTQSHDNSLIDDGRHRSHVPSMMIPSSTPPKSAAR
jgi:hypothetical protein